MNRPFLIPYRIQRKASSCRECGRDIGTAKRAEAVLLDRGEIGITRVRRCADRVEHKESDKVCLIEHVDMSICAKIAAITEIA